MHGIFSNETFVYKGQSFASAVTFLISLFFFIGIQPVVRHLLLTNVAQFKNFDKKRQRDWISRMVSCLHAVVFTILSFYILFISQIVYETVQEGSLRNRCPISFPTLSFSAAYFLVDLFFVVKHFPDTMTIVHHVGAAMAAIVITGYELGPVYMLVFGLTEASTPFVNLRVFLNDLGLKNSFIYSVNGVAMWLGFLIFRIPMIFYIPYLLIHYEHWKVFAFEGTYLMAFVVSSGYLAISILNIWWFYLITKGLFKVLLHKPTQKSTNEQLKKVQ